MSSFEWLKSDQLLVVLDFQGDEIILERLRELGVRVGTQLKYLCRAPFRGPFLFQFSTTLLALREEELLCLKFKQT